MVTPFLWSQDQTRAEHTQCPFSAMIGQVNPSHGRSSEEFKQKNICSNNWALHGKVGRGEKQKRNTRPKFPQRYEESLLCRRNLAEGSAVQESIVARKVFLVILSSLTSLILVTHITFKVSLTNNNSYSSPSPLSVQDTQAKFIHNILIINHKISRVHFLQDSKLILELSFIAPLEVQTFPNNKVLFTNSFIKAWLSNDSPEIICKHRAKL